MDKGFQAPQMICLICTQAAIVNGFTSVKLERGEMNVLVKNVPAQVCPGCGEAFLDEEIAVRLLRGAEEMSLAGALETEFDFRRFA